MNLLKSIAFATLILINFAMATDSVKEDPATVLKGLEKTYFDTFGNRPYFDDIPYSTQDRDQVMIQAYKLEIEIKTLEGEYKEKFGTLPNLSDITYRLTDPFVGKPLERREEKVSIFKQEIEIGTLKKTYKELTGYFADIQDVWEKTSIDQRSRAIEALKQEIEIVTLKRELEALDKYSPYISHSACPTRESKIAWYKDQIETAKKKAK